VDEKRGRQRRRTHPERGELELAAAPVLEVVSDAGEVDGETAEIVERLGRAMLERVLLEAVALDEMFREVVGTRTLVEREELGAEVLLEEEGPPVEGREAEADEDVEAMVVVEGALRVEREVSWTWG
jgi:hypothetical protein